MSEVEIDSSPVDDAHARSRLLLAAAERDQLELVLQLLQRALADGSPDAVVDVLLEGSCVLSNARVGWVVLAAAAADRVVVTGGPDAAWIDDGIQPVHWPIVSVALDGTPVHVSDVLGATDAGEPAAMTSDGRALRSLSAIPIPGEDDVHGALVLAHHRVNAFSDRQLVLVAALASHLGRALDMCEAVRSKTRVAAALQETLLPPVLPDVEGVELAAVYRPNGSGNLVGGDFYDVFGDGAGGWYVLLGDASGIGPEAAGLAGVARYTARALAETASGAREILDHLNSALLRAAPDDRFCTAVLLHFRSKGAGVLAVTLCSAGHPPPFLQRADGSVVPAIDVAGLILGVLPDAPVGEVALLLQPGDALVCYTDGVIEAHADDRQQFGEERLVRVLADARHRSAAGIARRIERAVVDFRSPDYGDDLAIVVVRSRPGS